MMARCVVCWERPAVPGGELACGCVPGCRGMSSVCPGCRERVERCVYCRAVVLAPWDAAVLVFDAWLTLMAALLLRGFISGGR